LGINLQPVAAVGERGRHRSSGPEALDEPAADGSGTEGETGKTNSGAPTFASLRSLSGLPDGEGFPLCFDSYIPIAKGHTYLVAVMDRHMRAVLSWVTLQHIGYLLVPDHLERGMHRQQALHLRDLVDRLLALDGLQGPSGLEIRTELSSFSLHGSLGFNTQRTRSVPFRLSPGSV